MNRLAQAQTDSIKDWIGRIKRAGIRGTADTLALSRVAAALKNNNLKLRRPALNPSPLFNSI